MAIMSGKVPYPYVGFECNEIIAIGFTNWAVPFASQGGGFSYHQVSTLVNNKYNKDTPIYDACLKLDIGTHPGKSSPSPKTPYLPVNYTFAETKVDTVNVDPTKEYTENFYRERLVKSKENCQISPEIYRVTGFDPSVVIRTEFVMPEPSKHFEHTKAIYGLEKNTLPTGNMHKGSQTLSSFSEMNDVTKTTETENYGRNCVYDVEYKNEILQVECTFALNEREAWLLLISALSCISAPHVRSIELGDKAFAINDSFVLFVKNNVLVQISCTGSKALDFATALEKTIR